MLWICSDLRSQKAILQKNKGAVMDKVLKQLKSFFYAARGIISVFVTEAHMRFHLVAAVYVLIFFDKFYNDFLNTSTIYILLLVIALVFVSEIFNTAIERLCDTVTKDYSKNIKYIKDASAGAVLISAIISVVVACKVFIKPDIIKYAIIPYFQSHTGALVLLILSIIVAVAFIVIPPEKYISFFKRLFVHPVSMEKETDKTEE